jgi:hypothetical protein
MKLLPNCGLLANGCVGRSAHDCFVGGNASSKKTPATWVTSPVGVGCGIWVGVGGRPPKREGFGMAWVGRRPTGVRRKGFFTPLAPIDSSIAARFRTDADSEQDRVSCSRLTGGSPPDLPSIPAAAGWLIDAPVYRVDTGDWHHADSWAYPLGLIRSSAFRAVWLSKQRAKNAR